MIILIILCHNLGPEITIGSMELALLDGSGLILKISSDIQY